LDPHEVPLSPAQRSKIRRLSAWKPPPPGEEQGELNIIPYLDIVMNIVVFVIATITVILVSTIDTSPPSAGGGPEKTQARSKALNLVVLLTSDGISLKTSSGQIATGCANLGGGVTVPKRADGQNDYVELKRCALELKRQSERFAEETQVTITANPDTEYQTVIDTIDALRKHDGESPTDPNDDVVLFPDIHFGVAR
jgi:biopolymer transport protein ExbD